MEKYQTHNNINEVLDVLYGEMEDYPQQTMGLLVAILKKNPKCISKKTVDYVVKKGKMVPMQGLDILEIIIDNKPELLNQELVDVYRYGILPQLAFEAQEKALIVGDKLFEAYKESLSQTTNRVLITKHKAKIYQQTK